MSHLWDALCLAYRVLGFESVTKGDNVFRDLVLARIIEPTSKADASRVLTEVGVDAASYATVKRRLPIYAQPGWRQSLAAACAEHAGLGPASLVLFDVSTLYFETDAGDGFREPGFSKERRLEPQITLGLLTDATGFPLTVEAFEGNKAETATMLPVINAFKAAHRLTDVTVVADAGMISEANQNAIAGRRVVVHPRHQDPVPARCGPRMARQATPVRRSPTGRCSPSRGRPPQPRRPAASRIGSSTTSTAMTGPGAPCAGSMSRSPKPSAPSRARPRSNATATSNCPARRSASTATWRPRPAPWPGWKGYTTNLTGADAGVRHRRLPPAVAHREELPDVQTRPAGPAGLPPQARIDRGPPDHRVRRPGRQPLDRAPNRLEHQEIRPHRPPLPHRPDPSRTAKPSPPPTPYPTTSAKPSPRSTHPTVRTNLAQVGPHAVTTTHATAGKNLVANNIRDQHR